MTDSLQHIIEMVQCGRWQDARALGEQLSRREPHNAQAWFVLGAIYGQLGAFDDAVACCRRVIELEPSMPAAYYNLGVALLKQGKAREAAFQFSRATELNPGFAEAFHDLGNACQMQGLLDAAAGNYRKAIALNPSLAEAHHNLGRVLHQQRQLSAAIESYRAAVRAQPNNALMHYHLGTALWEQGFIDDAAQSCREAIRNKPDFAEAHNDLGRMLQQQGKPEAAVECFLKAVEAQPDNAILHFNLGNAFWKQHSLEAAIQSYRKAVQINAEFADAYHNLGAVQSALGRRDDAISSYQTAVHIRPDYADTHMALANVYYLQGRFDDASRACEAVLRLKPGSIEPYRRLAGIYYEQGKFDLAKDCYRKIVDHPDQDGAKIQLAVMLPLIIPSTESIDALRDCLDGKIKVLLDSELCVKDPLLELGYTNFFLAYHGRNDLALQIKLAQLYIKTCPSLAYTAAHCQVSYTRIPQKKIKIGFISRYFRNHSIGRTSKGIIALLSRDLFEVFVLFLDSPQDETALFIQQHADKSLVLPGSVEAARECIAEQKLDILFYQDIGMDFFTSLLAMSRLAPIQCTSFGHPVTSGIPTIDYYISTDDWEPDDADEHYSEKLVRLRNVSSVAYYYKPDVPTTLKPRNYFGLHDCDHVYLCPQTLFKFHPEFDDLLACILRADPLAVIVLIEGMHSHWAELLRNRFKETIQDVHERIKFLPQQRGGDFINLIAVADVMLDTIHFCGFNTTLEAFAVGTPVVTMPGIFMRGRHTTSFYKKLGFTDCIAHTKEQYVDIAVHLGTDSDYRSRIKRKILQASSAIWQEIEVVREFERCFTGLVSGMGN